MTHVDESSLVLPASPPPILKDAVRYWEPRRIAYNLALIAVAAFVVARTWPHFRPAFKLGNIPRVAILAMLANVCYCAAYFVEFLVQDEAARATWRRRRSVLRRRPPQRKPFRAPRA